MNTEPLLEDVIISLTEELDLYAQRSQEAQVKAATAYCEVIELRAKIRKQATRIEELETMLKSANTEKRKLQQKVGMYQSYLKKKEVFPATKLT